MWGMLLFSIPEGGLGIMITLKIPANYKARTLTGVGFQDAIRYIRPSGPTNKLPTTSKQVLYWHLWDDCSCLISSPILLLRSAICRLDQLPTKKLNTVNQASQTWYTWMISKDTSTAEPQKHPSSIGKMTIQYPWDWMVPSESTKDYTSISASDCLGPAMGPRGGVGDWPTLATLIHGLCKKLECREGPGTANLTKLLCKKVCFFKFTILLSCHLFGSQHANVKTSQGFLFFAFIHILIINLA